MVDRAAVVTQIDTILKAVSDPDFQGYYVGEPIKVAKYPAVAFWYTGNSEPNEGRKTLGNTMVQDNFLIRCYFPLVTSPSIKKNVDLAIWDAVRNISAGLYGDANLGDLVTDLDVGDAVVDWMQWNSGAVSRIVTIPLELKDLEAETITP